MSDRRFPARDAIALLTDDFTRLPTPAQDQAADGPLARHGYDASHSRGAERTGEEESVVWGRATIRTSEAVLIVFEFGFLGGSLGERTGDRLKAAYTYAREHRLPVVSLIATPTADQLRLNSQDLVELGIVRGVVATATPGTPG